MIAMENLKWFGHASFSFTDEKGNKIYYVDPFELPTARHLGNSAIWEDVASAQSVSAGSYDIFLA